MSRNVVPGWIRSRGGRLEVEFAGPRGLTYDAVPPGSPSGLQDGDPVLVTLVAMFVDAVERDRSRKPQQAPIRPATRSAAPSRANHSAPGRNSGPRRNGPHGSGPNEPRRDQRPPRGTEHHARGIEHPAIAPYNFVRLPKAVPTGWGAPELLDRRRWHDDGVSGRITCSLETLTPFYVREGAGKDVADFFFVGDDPDNVRIPATTLKGMTRSLVEIGGAATPETALRNALVYRDPNEGRYSELFVVKDRARGLNRFTARVRAAIVERGDDGWTALRPAQWAKVEQRDLEAYYGLRRGEFECKERPPSRKVNIDQKADYAARGYGREIKFDLERDPDGSPKTEHTHRQWRFDPRTRQQELVREFLLTYPKACRLGEGALKGRLLMSGAMAKKHMEMLVWQDEADRAGEPLARWHETDDDSLEHGFVDQLTDWQEKAFAAGGSRAAAADGHLADGDPVLAVEDETGKILAFGRAQMFRLPFAHPPTDYLPRREKEAPERVSDDELWEYLDLAQAMFGFVGDRRSAASGGGLEKQKLAGRVFFGEAQLADAAKARWLVPQGRPLSVLLGSPKPTAYPMYLTQGERDLDWRDRRQNAGYDAGKLRKYNDRPGDTTLRGTKQYWHRRLDGTPREAYEDPASADQMKSQARPLDAGNRFTFEVDFDDLHRLELGALLFALELDGPDGGDGDVPALAHRLGMGKPLGFGSVRVRVDRLRLYDRGGGAGRYGRFFTEDLSAPHDGGRDADRADIDGFKAHFYAESVSRHEGAKVAPEGARDAFWKLDRMQDLRCLLSYRDAPHPRLTENMTVDNRQSRFGGGDLPRFQERRVLPLPQDVPES